MRVLIIALFYRTERIAFIKLLPGLLYKSFLSRRLIYYENININYIKWSESLTTRRYNVSINDLIEKLKNISI